MAFRLSNGDKIYIETKEGMYINFKPSSFKKKLKEIVGMEDIQKHMDFFRRLGWIIVADERKFTNVQRINDKIMKVITVDKVKYEVLKELLASDLI